MQTRDITEKLLLFKHRNNLTYIHLARELGISRIYLYKLIHGQAVYTMKTDRKIRDMFLRWKFADGLDEFKNV